MPITDVTPSPGARPTVLTGGWLFDGIDDSLTPDPAIVIEDGRFTAVRTKATIPPDATVVDLAGATLLPGLIDTHVHLCFDAGTNPVGRLADLDDTDLLAEMTTAARQTLRGGITTVRDLGDRGYLSLKLRESGDATVPTIVAAGPPITTAGGHCHYLGGAAEPGPAGMRAAVRQRAEHGVDVIKVMASGGVLTPGSKQELAQFTGGELATAVDEAHRHDLPVIAHVHGTDAIRAALAAEVDGLEHITFWSADGVDDPPPEMVRVIVERQIPLGLTLGLIPVPGIEPPPEIATRLPKILANARLLHDAGARCAVGTDAGIAPVKPHDVVRYSLPQLAALGFTPAEALRTLTAVAADVCGVGQSKGRISPGYDADILAVDGDPLSDTTAIHRIRAVYSRGIRVR